MQKTLLIISLCVWSGFSFLGCMPGKGMIPAPGGGGLDLGGSGVHSLDSSTAKESASTEDLSETKEPSLGPIAAGSDLGGASEGRVPAFGPDARPPLSDSEGVGDGELFAGSPSIEPAARRVSALPSPAAFRLIPGVQSYLLQELDYPLPSSLSVADDGSVKALLTVQASLATAAPDGTKKTRWWDLARGPYARVLIYRADQTPEQGRYVDLPVSYHGLKEVGGGYNLDIALPQAAVPGEKLAIFLYYRIDEASTSPYDYYQKPADPNLNAKQPIPFASPEKASQFFSDKEHVIFMNQFDLIPSSVAPKPLEASINDAVGFLWSDGTWVLAARPDRAGAPLPRMILKDKDALNLRLRFQFLVETDACPSCFDWRDAPEGIYGRLYVERSEGEGARQYYRDFKTEVLSTERPWNVEIRNSGLLPGDIVSLYIASGDIGAPSTWSETMTARDFLDPAHREFIDQYQRNGSLVSQMEVGIEHSGKVLIPIRMPPIPRWDVIPPKATRP